MDVSICKLETEDLKWVLEIENSSFKDPWTKGMFEEEIKNGDFYVVKEGDKIIGYGGFTKAMNEASLVNLAISQDYRRKGIATKLLEHLIKIAKEKKVERMFLEVRRENIGAISFYCKNGFKETGIRKDYYGKGEDAIIMSRKL